MALEPGVPCWSNKACREGRYNLCPDIKFFATPPHHGSLMQVQPLSFKPQNWNWLKLKLECLNHSSNLHCQRVLPGAWRRWSEQEIEGTFTSSQMLCNWLENSLQPQTLRQVFHIKGGRGVSQQLREENTGMNPWQRHKELHSASGY